MKKIEFLIGAVILLLQIPFGLFGQQQTEVLLTIDGEPITKAEFVRLYQKNNQNLQNDSLKKSPEEYMELFINYKLKVLEAKKLQMDTVASFREEFKKYRDLVAKPYLSYSNITDESLHKAYQHMTTEIKASHILVGISSDSPHEKVDSAYHRCLDIRKQIRNGADFGEMARKFSDDPSAPRNSGMLGYFTAFQMVPEFEDAAFDLEPGEISVPVRTQFGFHLIRIEDKRPAAGKLQVAHIMKRLPPAAPSDFIESAQGEMDSLKHLLDHGASFSELARRYSDDKQSATNGGVLPGFTATEMVPEFAEAAFTLKNDGDISPVIRTPYGLHIIKRLHQEPVPDFETLKSLITNKLKNNPLITEHNQELFLQHLKEIYDFRDNPDAKTAFFNNFRAAFRDRKADEPDSMRANETLFQIDSVSVSQRDFIAYLERQHLDSNADIPTQLNHWYNKLVSDKLIEKEDDNLEKKYPEFRYLVQEYYDGILLFNLSEEKIWNKASEDTMGLQSFYAKHNDLFQWEKRFNGWAIRCENQDVRDYIDDIFAEDANISKNELVDLLNVKFKNQAFVQKGTFAQGTNDLVDYLVWNKAQPQNFKDGLCFVRGDLIPPSPKTLDEARGEYLAAYQDELEKEWISDLREKHKVRVNKKILKTIKSIK